MALFSDTDDDQTADQKLVFSQTVVIPDGDEIHTESFSDVVRSC
jgi:hypothetical protein